MDERVAMQQHHFSATRLIFSEGDAADCAYLVEEGWVEIFAELRGGRKPLSLIGPGQIFGEMGVIDGSPRSATALAATHCRLLRITIDQFQSLLGNAEPFHAELLTKLVARFRDAQRAYLTGDTGLRTETADMGPGYSMLARHRDIADALAGGEIEPFLQPIVDMASNRWCGFEALARWRSPEHGLMPPADFLPLAECTGLIRQIDLVIAERAMELCQTLNGPVRPYLNVNFSAWHFRDDSLIPQLSALIERTGFDPGRLRVELTETLMIDDPERALKVMTGLERLGFRLALDDFGTGYSSLSVLHRMPIHVLKIDRALVSGVLTRNRPRAVLCNVVALARDLGMEVVIEGVEDTATAAALLDLGCNVAQGFLFARPMPAAEAVVEWQSRCGMAEAPFA